MTEETRPFSPIPTKIGMPSDPKLPVVNNLLESNQSHQFQVTPETEYPEEHNLSGRAIARIGYLSERNSLKPNPELQSRSIEKMGWMGKIGQVGRSVWGGISSAGKVIKNSYDRNFTDEGKINKAKEQIEKYDAGLEDLLGKRRKEEADSEAKRKQVEMRKLIMWKTSHLKELFGRPGKMTSAEIEKRYERIVEFYNKKEEEINNPNDIAKNTEMPNPVNIPVSVARAPEAGQKLAEGISQLPAVERSSEEATNSPSDVEVVENKKLDRTLDRVRAKLEDEGYEPEKIITAISLLRDTLGT